MPLPSIEPAPAAVGLIGSAGKADGLGAGIARCLRRGGLNVVAHVPGVSSAAAEARESGVILCRSLREMARLIPSPRTIWLTMPAGLPTRSAIDALQSVLTAGDVVVDCAQGHFEDALQHAAILAPHGIEYVDAGMVGQPAAVSCGYTVLLGGGAGAIKKLVPALTALTIDGSASGQGWLHCGTCGAGHFVSMVQKVTVRGVWQSLSHGMEFFGRWQEKGQEKAGVTPAMLAEIWRAGAATTAELQQLAAAYLAASAAKQSGPTPAINLARSLCSAAEGANFYMQQLETLLKRHDGAGQA